MAGKPGRHHRVHTTIGPALSLEPGGAALGASVSRASPDGAAGAATFAAAYFRKLATLFANVDTAAIASVAQALLDARERGARIFVLGNGGSAATASHFANDIGIGTRTWDRPFHIVSLSDNAAVITAIANDYGYDQVFTRQLAIQMLPGDVVIAISASGNSPNVVAAVEYANRAGGVTVGLTGFDGGRLRRLARLGVHVPTSKGEYGPVEDVHMVLDHLLTGYLLQACRTLAAAQS
jgi:D-sedoheptulose 7-phosphate isomerase